MGQAVLKMEETLRRTPLYALHQELGAKIVPFAGYDMPVQYPAGILAEHAHTRTAAGVFDVSHMGQIFINGPDTLARLENVLSADLQNCAIGGVKYNFLLKEQGGVLDDLMVSRLSADEVFVVVNASRKDHDLAWFQKHLSGLNVQMRDDLALVALQGPKAAEVLARFCAAPAKLKFMQIGRFELKGAGTSIISRSGYTGEDGFEISVSAANVTEFMRALLAEAEVKPVGLGARDTLRLEAGLCLYGHELDETINPVEADILWAVPKARRETGGYIGAEVVKCTIANGATRKRVAIKPEGRAPARDGTLILDQQGNKIGIITSGGYGPTVGGPIAMGYVSKSHAAPQTNVWLEVRGNRLPAMVVALPFTPHRYFR